MIRPIVRPYILTSLFGGKNSYPSPTALLKTGNGLGLAFFITSVSGLSKSTQKYPLVKNKNQLDATYYFIV